MENIIKNEFQFYSKLAKPLILNLPKSTDRIRAAAWIKKFMEEAAGEERLRTTYLKLLLFCLQRRRLTGIFADDPTMYDVLEELPIECDLNELARNLLEQEQAERKERIKLEMMGDMLVFPAYTTDCSPDLTEYVAAQDIPNFGVHAYYALSKQPINKWQNADKAILPKGTKSAIDTSITATAVQVDASCVCAPKSAASAPEVESVPADGDLPECRKKKDTEPERKKRRSKSMGQSPPTRPIGEVHHKVEEERQTPTWGTNLLEVKELSDIGKIDEPTEAQIQLEEEVSKIMEEEGDQDDDDREDPTSSKANDMLDIIDEWKHNNMNKSKKIPARLAKLGDRSGIKVPKTTTAGPKIAVKGMKKGKGKGKGKYGRRPDNLPAEFADWTEKDLEETELTWADLMPVDENIDDELQRIEDEGMAGLDDDFAFEDQFNPYDDLTDYDAMLREAEADLERHKTSFDAGFEEDEQVVDLFDDEIEELEDQLNVSRAAEEVQTASPALTEGIPVTTPRRSPIPRRSRSPEKSFAEDDDVLLKSRASPLRAPKEHALPKKKSGLPIKSRIPPPKSSIKDPKITQVYQSARAAVDESCTQRDDELDEFERLEREFAGQEGFRSPLNSTRLPLPPPRSPERAQQQEQILRTPPRAPVDPAYLQFASEFSGVKGGLEDDAYIPCSPFDSPNKAYSPTTGQVLPIPEFDYGPDDVGSPNRFDYMARPQTPEYIRQYQRRAQMEPNEFKFTRDYQDLSQDENIQGEQPCDICSSPPPMTEEEEFEMLENFYASPSQRPPQAALSPTTGAILPIPEFDYGPEDVDDPYRFEYMNRPRHGTPEDIKELQQRLGMRQQTPSPTRPPPPRSPAMPTQQEQQLQRATADAMKRAWEQEVRLRMGSPEAAEIINEAQDELQGDRGRRLRVGFDKMIEESPPPGMKILPQGVKPPPRPVFSPTTGAPLPIPDFDIAPEQLGVPWEDAEDIPEFELERPLDYLYAKTMEERKKMRWQEETDIFERCGDRCTVAGDTDLRQQFQTPRTRPPRPVSPELYAPRIIEDDNMYPLDESDHEPPSSPRTPIYQLPRERPLRFQSPFMPGIDSPITPPMQRPEKMPCGYRSPFEPGISSPRTPVMQHPEEMPSGYKSPFKPGISSPLTPPWQYPVDVFKAATLPPEDGFSPLPMEAFWDPLDYVGMGLSDEEGLEDVLPFETPEPRTPCGERRMPSPSMRFPTTPAEPSWVPLGPDGRPLVAKRLFTGEESPQRAMPPRGQPQSRLPARGQMPTGIPSRGQIPSRLPQRGQIISRIPSKGKIPSGIPSMRQALPKIPSRGPIPSRIPSMGQATSRLQQPGGQRPASRPGPCPPRRQIPEAAEYIGTPEPRTSIVRRGFRQPVEGTPTKRGLVDRPRRRLFEDDDIEDKSTCGVCGKQESPGRRSPKHVSPPPFQPPPVSAPWLTPEGEAGPSRRPTGLTPDGYNSDFEDPPPLQTPGTPRFPPARRIKKTSRPLRTPTDQRRIPCSGMRPSRAPKVLSRTLGGPDGRPQRPQEEPPVVFSPMEPFIPDKDTWVPPPPKYYKDPMFFPAEVMDTDMPADFPTISEINKNQRYRDKRHTWHSRYRGPTAGGPGPFIYRSSRQVRQDRERDVPCNRRMMNIPEYEEDADWRHDLFRRTDVDMWDYISEPPSGQQPPPPRPFYIQRPWIPQSPMATKDPIPEEEVEDISGYEDFFKEMLDANVKLQPEQYPPPVTVVRRTPCRQGPSIIQRTAEFLHTEKFGLLPDERDLREFGAIAEGYSPGRLLDQTPPDQIGRNYYGEILQGVETLGRSLTKYGIPESPPPGPQVWSPASVPSGSPRTPPPRQPAPPMPCGAGKEVSQRPSQRRVPPKPKQLRETKSSQLRKVQQAKKLADAIVKLSPTSRMMKKKKEKAAKVTEERKKQAAAKRKADEEAKQAESMARIAEGLPGGKMRPLDYREAKGTGQAAHYSAKKAPTRQMDAQEVDAARRQLFGGQAPGAAEGTGIPRGLTGRKCKGKKGPGVPSGVFRRRDSEDELAAPLAQRGPEFMTELIEHEIQFPRRQEGVVMRGGKYKKVSRRSDQAFDQMGEITEEPRSPCGTCEEGEEDEDEYEAALKEIGITAEQAAKIFDPGFLDELEEDDEEAPGSPNAIQALEAQFREMDEYMRQQAESPQRSPTAFELAEQAVMQREQEEREMFERMMEREAEVQSPGGRCPAESQMRTPTQRVLTEEEEQLEFENLERQIAERDGQGDRSPRGMPQMNEAVLQQEINMQRRVFEQQLQLQGPSIRGRQYPAAGIPYSPPRPQGIFGPAPYTQPAGRLPATPPMPVSPPRYPPRRPPPSPGIPTAPSPPPSPPGILEQSPPFFGDMDEEDRLLSSPCRPRPPLPPRWTPTPSPPRGPTPPPYIPTPPSPPLLAQEVRQQISLMARPEFDPARRRDILGRDERRAFKAPSVGLYNVREDEPLIPEFDGNESFMGWPVVAGERVPRKRRRRNKNIKAQRLFDDSNEPEEDYILDDSIPEDLPGPMLPKDAETQYKRELLEPIELAPWQGVGYRDPDPGWQRFVPQLEMPVHTEIYQGGGTIHPDLADMVGYEPPLPVSEDMEDLGCMGEELFYSPERYPEIDERELDREAALAYEPPNVMKNIWLASPQELGAFTPPSVGKGPCGTYSPTATPPLQLLDSPNIQDLGDEFLAPDINVPGPTFEDFMQRTPPLEQITSIQELRYRTGHAKGREGIKPKPMYFGGYGETPRRPIPRWYGRGGQTNVLQEVEEPYTPPTPGTPPPQFPAPLGYYSPELDEFQQLEQQVQEEERASRRSRRREKREAKKRQMMRDELTEQAERREMDMRMTSRRGPSPPRVPSPPPRMPSPPPLPPVQYGPEMQTGGGPRSPCGPPPIDHRALEQFMLEEMGVDPYAAQLETPPGTPALMEDYNIFEGMESPPPLSPKAGPCMTCTPPAPPSPPPPPESPQRPQWKIYAEQMEREARARQDREDRKQQLYQRNLDEIQQMFGPSPGPLSPGPDADFYANIYGHQVPAGFREGDRPRTAVRDQIGTREFTMRIPRHTAPQGLATETIIEPRVRTTVPESSRRRRPPVARRAPVADARPAPRPQVEHTSSAQRIAEARKHYQQMGRQKRLVAPQGGQRVGPCQRTQPQPQTQLNLQPMEDFLRQAGQQQAAPEAPRVKITPEEAQRRARERLRARRNQEQAGPPSRSRQPQQAAPPPPTLQPFTGFLPAQVQRQMPRQLPQQQIQSIDDFVRRGPRPGAGSHLQLRSQPSRSGTQLRRQPSAGSGCGGGSGGGCGSGRQAPPQAGGSGGGCGSGRQAPPQAGGSGGGCGSGRQAPPQAGGSGGGCGSGRQAPPQAAKRGGGCCGGRK